jgi:hypothetical protein
MRASRGRDGQSDAKLRTAGNRFDVNLRRYMRHLRLIVYIHMPDKPRNRRSARGTNGQIHMYVIPTIRQLIIRKDYGVTRDLSDTQQTHNVGHIERGHFAIKEILRAWRSARRLTLGSLRI